MDCCVQYVAQNVEVVKKYKALYSGVLRPPMIPSTTFCLLNVFECFRFILSTAWLIIYIGRSWNLESDIWVMTGLGTFRSFMPRDGREQK